MKKGETNFIIIGVLIIFVILAFMFLNLGSIGISDFVKDIDLELDSIVYPKGYDIKAKTTFNLIPTDRTSERYQMCKQVISWFYVDDTFIDGKITRLKTGNQKIEQTLTITTSSNAYARGKHQVTAKHQLFYDDRCIDITTANLKTCDGVLNSIWEVPTDQWHMMNAIPCSQRKVSYINTIPKSPQVSIMAINSDYSENLLKSNYKEVIREKDFCIGSCDAFLEDELEKTVEPTVSIWQKIINWFKRLLNR